MHGAGRVRRHELDVDPLAVALGHAAEGGAGGDRGAQDAPPLPGPKPQVQEARPRHLGRGDARVGGQPFGEPLRDVARLHPGGLGQHHRGVRRHVAMGRVARRLDRDGGEVEPAWQRPGIRHGVERVDQEDADIGENVHHQAPSVADPIANAPARRNRGARGAGCARGAAAAPRRTANPPPRPCGRPCTAADGAGSGAERIAG